MISPLIARLAASIRLDATSSVAKIGRIAVQSAAIAGVWFAADYIVRRFGLPVPGGVVGLVALLALLFFIPAAVAAVQYGGLFREDGWRLALVVVAGTLMVMVAVAFAVEQAARLERRLALRRVMVQRAPVERRAAGRHFL